MEQRKSSFEEADSAQDAASTSLIADQSHDATPSLKLVHSQANYPIDQSPPISHQAAPTTSAGRLAQAMAPAKNAEALKPAGGIKPLRELSWVLIFGAVAAVGCNLILAYKFKTVAYPLFSLIILAPAIVAASWPIRLGHFINGRAGKELVENGKPAMYAALHPLPLYISTLSIILMLRDYTYWETGERLVGIGGIIALMMLIVHSVIHLEWQYRFASRFRTSLKIEKPYPLLMLAATLACSLPAALYSPLWLILLFIVQAYYYQSLSKQASAIDFDQVKLQKDQVDEYVNAQDLILPYMHHVEFERWWKQRFTVRSTWKAVLMALIACGLLTMNLPALIIFALAMFLKESLPNAPLNAITAASQANYSLTFMLLFLAGLSTGVLIFIRNHLKKPDALAVGQNGIRFRYPTITNRIDPYLCWSDLDSIDIQRSAGKQDMLIFVPKTTSQALPLIVKPESLGSAEARESLLSAIEFYAPQLRRSPEVIETLQSTADQNYTELWLQALSAPPQRERLKPLMNGISLLQGRFQILKQLGSGGQGFAYLVEDERREETLVLKEFILPIFVDVEERKRALKRFEDEARLLGSLDHPRIVKQFGFFVEDHRAYLVLEHIDGQNLREHISQNGPMTEFQAKQIALQLAEILIYIHNLTPPLVHRDFTPDNLILSKDGQVKLIDFNVAQQTDSSKTGTVVGKQSYLPPEQFRGLATPRSDLYALGATLYFLVTGHDPMAISVSSPNKDGVAVSESFNEIIESLTQVEETARMQSAEDLLEALRN